MSSHTSILNLRLKKILIIFIYLASLSQNLTSGEKNDKNTQFKSKGAFFSREIKFNTINLSNNLTSTNVTNDNISNKRFIKNKISSFNRLITETNYEKSKLLNEEKLKFRKK